MQRQSERVRGRKRERGERMIDRWRKAGRESEMCVIYLRHLKIT